MKVLAIVVETCRELVHRRALPVYFGIITLTHLFFLLALQTDVADGMIASLRVMGLQGRTSAGIRVEEFVGGLQLAIAFVLFPLGILMSVFATASLVPRMLERGSIDLLLSKPVPRALLFASRCLGALLAAGSSLVYLVGGLGVILGVKTGVWNGGFFLAGLLMALYFACLLGFLALSGVVSRSTSVAVMVTALLFLAGLVVRAPHEGTRWPLLITSRAWRFAARSVVETLYHVLPRTYDFGQMVTGLTLGREVVIWEPALSSALAGAGALAAATLYFARKDF
ncbi:MAG: ABC transporter permease subunit [Acidobacteriota bacterium]